MRYCLPIALALLPLFISGHLVNLNDEVKEVFLLAHNEARAKVGAKPLTWHKNAEGYARIHISKCVLDHIETPYGENLYSSPAQPSNLPKIAAAAVEAWVDGKQFADPPVWKCVRGKCGHYSQVIWRETKFLGCAISSCRSKYGTLIACLYYPPGNTVGRQP